MLSGESAAITYSALAAGFGALLSYVASRALAEPAGAGNNGVTPARAATGHWLVIAAIVIVALIAGRDALAIGVIFSTSVAALSMALGLILALTTAPDDAQPPQRWRHGATAWRMLVPATLIPLLGGFSGRLSLLHAAALLTVGILAAWLWREGRTDAPAAEAAAPKRRLSRPIQFALGIVLAGVAAVLVFRGVWGINQLIGVPESGIATALLGPMLVLPIIASATQSGAGHRREMVARCSAVALLNLCLLLPLVIVLGIGRQMIAPNTGNSSNPFTTASHWLVKPAWSTAPVLVQVGPATAPSMRPAPAEEQYGVVLPMVIWRVDCPCLVVLALVLVPISLGRWELGGLESLMLAAFYFLYVVTSARVLL